MLIFGGSGAVGSLAIRMARFKGVRAGDCIRADATAFVQELGAEAAIDALQPDAAERLREIAPDGLDAGVRAAGGDALDRLLEPRPRAWPDLVSERASRAAGAAGVRVLHYDAVANPRCRGAGVVDEGRPAPIAASAPRRGGGGARAVSGSCWGGWR